MATSRSDREDSATSRPGTTPPHRLLIANRGEIALRLVRAARDEGWISIAVYSEADARSPHAVLADEAWPIGPAPSAESYLHVPRILEAARRSRATHVHPGYGFLSENAEFAEACAEAGLVFVGPPPHAIRTMGDKVAARDAAARSGVPLIRGTGGLSPDPDEAVALARELGWPVLIKAAFGGGGRGMRLCGDERELRSALEMTRSEAGRAFGNDLVYLEQAIPAPRHVEIQVLCDAHGNGIHLGERECSIQRRHQKLIEESPSVALDAERRARMGEAAVRLALGIGYVGAGTVEFLVGPGGDFHFLEMNTRLQVEHPVTEEVTGIDLVRAQLRVALGEPLPWSQEDVRQRGWSIECRINAEDPSRAFLPASGPILWARLPQGPGIRNDVGFESGGEASRHYDSMLGKLVAWGRDREEARVRLLRALEEYAIEGIVTNLPFHRWALRHPAFIAGEIHTGFVEEHFRPEVLAGDEDEEWLARLAVVARFRERERPLGAPPPQRCGEVAVTGAAPGSALGQAAGGASLTAGVSGFVSERDPMAPRISPWKRSRRSAR